MKRQSSVTGEWLAPACRTPKAVRCLAACWGRDAPRLLFLRPPVNGFEGHGWVWAALLLCPPDFPTWAFVLLMEPPFLHTPFLGWAPGSCERVAVRAGESKNCPVSVCSCRENGSLWPTGYWAGGGRRIPEAGRGWRAHGRRGFCSRTGFSWPRRPGCAHAPIALLTVPPLPSSQFSLQDGHSRTPEVL